MRAPLNPTKTLLPASSEPPIFLIVAGPNGSGKSTVYNSLKTDITAFGHSVWIINPDLLAKRISETEQMPLGAANICAVCNIESWLDASIRCYQTIGVETVLSTAKYRRLVELAKARLFQVRLIYVLLDSPDRNVERVRERIKSGGHSVPEDKIRARYAKSLDQLPWFLEKADQALIFDNSEASPRQIGQKLHGILTLDDRALPQLVAAARKIESQE